MINILQENNKNLLAITSDYKVISSKLSNGEGKGEKERVAVNEERLHLPIIVLKSRHKTNTCPAILFIGKLPGIFSYQPDISPDKISCRKRHTAVIQFIEI